VRFANARQCRGLEHAPLTARHVEVPPIRHGHRHVGDTTGPHLPHLPLRSAAANSARIRPSAAAGVDIARQGGGIFLLLLNHGDNTRLEVLSVPYLPSVLVLCIPLFSYITESGTVRVLAPAPVLVLVPVLVLAATLIEGSTFIRESPAAPAVATAAAAQQQFFFLRWQKLRPSVRLPIVHDAPFSEVHSSH
jgi:hypothetical protein